MSPEPREATVTLMFADVAKSTELAVQAGDEKARRLIRSQQEMIRETVAANGGREVDAAGDGLFAAFDSARRGVRCAVEIQRRATNQPDAPPLRIGLHVGDALEDGALVFGATVNAAARVAALAVGGQILVSDIVRRMIGKWDETGFDDLGIHKLKGFAEKWRIHEVRWSDAPAAMTGEEPDKSASSDDAPGERIRIVIVDDEALVRAGFRMLLEPQLDFEIVGEAGDGAEAVSVVKRLKPDVVLMDVRMPKVSGLEATTQLADLLGRPTRVLMLTTFDLDEYVYQALRAGASGFLLKDTPPEQLINAVRVIAAGEALLAPTVTRRLIEEFAKNPPRNPPRELEMLTARELEVLELVGKGMSTGEIASHLFVSEATVKTHVARVLTKLNLRDRAQAVVFCYESGLLQPGAG